MRFLFLMSLLFVTQGVFAVLWVEEAYLLEAPEPREFNIHNDDRDTNIIHLGIADLGNGDLRLSLVYAETETAQVREINAADMQQTLQELQDAGNNIPQYFIDEVLQQLAPAADQWPSILLYGVPGENMSVPTSERRAHATMSVDSQ